MRIYLARPLLAYLKGSATTEPRAAERVEPGPQIRCLRSSPHLPIWARSADHGSTGLVLIGLVIFTQRRAVRAVNSVA